ncbi:hypothetical protein HDU97_001360 [Phlyctochytrium planicorne]|nr:hypothetical protein HDU97_001360 [Phlyctochytrium planicorne]
MTLMPSWYNWFKFDGFEPLINNDIPSIPFPQMRSNVSRVEVVSVDAVSVSARSSNRTAALALLEYMAGVEAHKHGLETGAIFSPFLESMGASNSTDYQLLSTAELVPWFETAASTMIYDYAMMAFRDFYLNNSMWAKSAKSLDDLVLEYNFRTTPSPDVWIENDTFDRSSKNATGRDQFYLDNATVVFAPTTSNALIYYTIDGMDPIVGVSTLYQKPITVVAPKTSAPVTFVIKAVSFKPGLASTSSFGLVWGNILAKGYRIYRLFNNKKAKTIIITNKSIFLWSGSIVGIDIALCLIYTFAYRPKPTYRMGPTKMELTCRSDNFYAEVILISVFIAYNGALVLCGVALAILTRNVSSDYSESQVLGYTTFTFFVVSIVTLPLFLLPNMDYVSRFGLIGGITLVLTAIIVFLFCGTKIIYLARDLGVFERIFGRNASNEVNSLVPAAFQETDGEKRKDDDENIHEHSQLFSTTLFCLQPGIFSRWKMCRLVRIPVYSLLYISSLESSSTIFSADIQHCSVDRIVRGRDEDREIWFAVLAGPGRQSIKIQAKNRKVLEDVLGV